MIVSTTFEIYKRNPARVICINTRIRTPQVTRTTSNLRPPREPRGPPVGPTAGPRAAQPRPADPRSRAAAGRRPGGVEAKK